MFWQGFSRAFVGLMHSSKSGQAGLQTQVVAEAIESGAPVEEDGVEDAFNLLNEVSEHARSGECCPLVGSFASNMATD